MIMQLLIWGSFVCAVIWQVDALFTQALLLACTDHIVKEMRKLRPTHNGGESDG